MSRISIRRAWVVCAAPLAGAAWACVSFGQVVINELMYAPYEPFGTTNATEYIELYNAGDDVVDLSLYRFDGGVEYEFAPGTLLAPGEFGLLCEDLAAFSAAYPSVTSVLDEYRGSLDNGGERVTLSRLESGTWVEADSIRFIDGGPSDGTGPSLELVHPGFTRLRNHFAGAWMASTEPLGTPGEVNSVDDPTPSPVAGDVQHDPPLPFPGSVVTVRARVAAAEPGALSQVNLEYRKDELPQGPWLQATMMDDGSNGDLEAGDGIYAAQVPAAGDSLLTDGDLLEFRITATDTGGLSRTEPSINRSGVANGPFSYLCPFGEDAGFTGEYPTYHLLMTQANRRGPDGLEIRSDNSNILLDATFITTGGRIIYNCGTRYRGKGSRVPPYSFRLEFPRGETWKGYQDINFLHNQPLLQYIGMRTVTESGQGNLAPEVALCRLWLNNSLKSDQVNDYGYGGVYVRMEKVGHDFIAKHYPNADGNIYRGENSGHLDYRPELADYQNGDYRVETNNPFTVYHSLSNLCWTLDQDPALFPEVLPTRVNVDQWARHYAVQTSFDNSEGGLFSANATRGDDYYIYADPVDGQFDLLPWDFDTILDPDAPAVNLTRSIWAWASNSGASAEIIGDVLTNPPAAPRYVGHLVDVLNTLANREGLSRLFDEMGSAMSPTYRAKLLEAMEVRRASILSQISTQLTASVSGALEEGPSLSVVSNPTISMTGQGPQAWTTRISVQGTEAPWDTRTGTWSTPGDLVLPARHNEIRIEAYDEDGRLLQSLVHTVIVVDTTIPHGGDLSLDTMWAASDGVHHVTEDVTVTGSARLTVQPDAVVILDPGVRIRVLDGTLDIRGEVDRPVRWYPADGSSTWLLEAEGPDAAILGIHGQVLGGQIRVSQGARLVWKDGAFAGTGAEAIISTETGAHVELSRCHVTDYGQAIFRNSTVDVDACLFERMSLAGLDLVGSTGAIREATVRRSLSPWPVDGIRVRDGSAVQISGCLVRDLSGTGISAGAIPRGTSQPVVMTPSGAEWAYLDDGTDPGPGWTARGFDDTSWASGPAQLGYGDGDETTVVDSGPAGERYRTTYFRHMFAASNAWEVTGVSLRVLRDDGVIVYLNGTEVFRDNMPPGPVDNQTWAEDNIAGSAEDTFYEAMVDGSLVVPGTNVLAAEIHQASASSVDISFDLEATADVIVDTGSGGAPSSVTIDDSLIHDCAVGVYHGTEAALTNRHTTITACDTGIRGGGVLLPELHVRDNYLPGVPVLVRVDMRDELGTMGRDLWDATAFLESSDPEITLSTNRFPLFNGRGSALVTITGGGSFVLTANVNGKRAGRPLISLADAPVQTPSGPLTGETTSWTGVVHVTEDLLVPTGHTLQLAPGTLVLLDGAPSGSGGIDIDVAGSIQSLGTADQPVTFTAFSPTEGWGEIHHQDAAVSRYQHTILTRAGRSPGVGHTGSGPALRLDNAAVVFDQCSVTDLDGKVMYATAGSDVTFRESLLSRAVMGPELAGTAALLEETWITEMWGVNDNDGIYLHDQQPGQDLILRRGVHAGFDDDAIDTLQAEVQIEDTIARDAFDKGLSVFGGLADLRNFVSTDNGIGISLKQTGTGTGRVNLDHGLIVGNAIGIQVRDKTGEPDVFLEYYVSNSIIEPVSASSPDPIQTDYNPTNIHVRYSMIGETWAGQGNLTDDPLFVDPAAHDFRLQPGSPGIDAGDPASPPDPDGSVTDIGAYPAEGGESGVTTVLDAIGWGNGNEIAGRASVAWSTIRRESVAPWPGPENLNRNPWFRDTDERDHRLLPVSPCLAAASDGGDRGVSFPTGANPTAPTGLSLQSLLVGETNQVRLAWVDGSNDETYFEIQRSWDGTTWTTQSNTPADTTEWVDPSLPQDTWVSYRVRAGHARGESLFSEEPSVVTARTTTLQALVDGLRLTEIMYNPADSDNDVHEYLELQNLGPIPLDLTGLRFTNGIDFHFAPDTILDPGAFFLIVKDPTAFATRYPGVAWDGVFENGTGLRNSGEVLEIQDAEGNRILQVEYDDGQSGAWYPTTDGDGYALVLADPDGHPDHPATWRAGSSVHGSPGAVDPAAPLGTIVINELLSHSDLPLEDAIELYNAGSEPVDIAGWYLSDDSQDLKRYRIPGASLVIPPDGYVVFYAGASFADDPTGETGFALSELGESLYLSSAVGTNLTSFRTWVKFGAADNGVSFGRHQRGDGVVDFEAQSERTFGVDDPATVQAFRTGTGLPNAAPRVGPVVINEIMYNPAATGKEFIELVNITATNVPLFDVAVPTNTWALDGAVEFVIPEGTWLAPGERALLTGVEPESFRAQFGLTNTALQVLGPFVGDLNNGGESVKLYKPGVPEPDGFVPRIRLDRVKYDDEAPWPPAADNQGPSLERVDPTAYGNDPLHWSACTLGGTPGAPNNAACTPSVGFSRTRDSGTEATTTLSVELSLFPATAHTVTVHYVVGGTATAGADYALAGGTAVFWPHDETTSIPLDLFDDLAAENDEEVRITLTTVSGPARLGGHDTYTYTILDADDDAVPAPAILPGGTNTFTDSILVTITSALHGAAIYFTTDGSFPTDRDDRYESPLTVTASTRLRARTYRGAINAGPAAEALFLQQLPLGPPRMDNRPGAEGVGLSVATLTGHLLSAGEAPTRVTAYWGPENGGDEPTAWAHAIDLGIRTEGPVSAPVGGLQPEIRYYYRFHGTNDFGEHWATPSASFSTVSGRPVVENVCGLGDVSIPYAITNVFRGADWHFLDDGSDQGTNWVGIAFDDTAWTNGPAPLGYGDNDEATVVGFGPDADSKYITTYFRHVFELFDPSGITGLTARVQRDDGIVVHVNGTEIGRDNLRLGAIDFDTTAEQPISSGDEDAYIDLVYEGNPLVSGTNLVAVEIHQSSDSSSDISFDLELMALGATVIGGSASNLTEYSARVRGSLISTGAAPSEVFVYWGRLDGGSARDDWLHATPLGVWGDGEVHTTLSGLLPGAEYFYRFAASNDFGWRLADCSASFTPPLLDLDEDGLSDTWEREHFDDLPESDGTGDADGDGQNDFAEQQAGTQPTNATSVLRLTLQPDPSGDKLILNWPSAPERLYNVSMSTNLFEVWRETGVRLPATPPWNTTTESMGATPPGYFRIRVE